MKLPIWLIDTFTSIPFRGNPTAVCCSNEELAGQTMQSVAHELNCPVTAFIKTKTGVAGAYDIRYFTPVTEIPACGHATLASVAFITQGKNKNVNITFYTANGIAIETTTNSDLIMMSYPVYQMNNCAVSNEMMDALHLKMYRMAGYSTNLETLFIEIDSPGILRTIQPDYQKLVRCGDQVKEVVVTWASGDEDYDYLLRSFCPWIGIDEDPVTGSVHSVLGNFWKERLGKNNMVAYQASARGGEIFIRAFDNNVEIGGRSVIFLKGEITVN